MRALFLLVLGLAACAAPAAPSVGQTAQAPAASDVGVGPGQRAPDFQVTSLDGQPLANAQVSGGKPYVLYYFATW